MQTNSSSYDLCCQNKSSDVDWDKLYHILTPLVNHWVLSSHIPIWSPQRDEIVMEVVQEAITRTFDRFMKGCEGKLAPVESPKRISIIIAHNYYIDLVRRDKKLVLITPLQIGAGHLLNMHESSEQLDPSELASENAYNAEVFDWIVLEIVKFPLKLRTALLIDLASRMTFEREITPLQQAFYKIGIALEHYASQVPGDLVKRSRHASLVSLAYKRIGKLARSCNHLIVI